MNDLIEIMHLMGVHWHSGLMTDEDKQSFTKAVFNLAMRLNVDRDEFMAADKYESEHFQAIANEWTVTQ